MRKKSFMIFLIALFMALLSSIVIAQELPIGLQKLKQYEQELASSITFLLAFFAGLLTMTSPCGIALLPTYFSFAFKDRKKSLLMTAVFSAGLLAAFVLFGIIAGILGNFFNEYKLALAVISGYILIFFAILLFFNAGFSIFSFKLDYEKGKGFFSVALLGFFFGVGWTPCAGPILVGILLLAANSATMLNGILMLLFYGIGIVAPLMLLSYFSDRHNWADSRLLRGKSIQFSIFGKNIITHTYNLIGGVLLAAIGILMVLFKGTFFFQSELPKYIPWSMSLLYALNEKALESKLLTSALGNILGLGIVLAVLILIIYLIKKKE